MELMGLPLSFDGERPPIRSRAPRLGEHTADVAGAVRKPDGRPRT